MAKCRQKRRCGAAGDIFGLIFGFAFGTGAASANSQKMQRGPWKSYIINTFNRPQVSYPLLNLSELSVGGTFVCNSRLLSHCCHNAVFARCFEGVRASSKNQGGGQSI